MALLKKKALPAPKSVASIVSGLNNTLVELQVHAEDQASQAQLQKSFAESALAAAEAHEAEAAQAAKVASNIKALLGA